MKGLVKANRFEVRLRRGTLRDKSHFYNIAQGSLEELRYCFVLAKDLGFMKENKKWLDSAEETGRMLYGPIRSIQ
ncbi:MAG TPA: four helix bundle protein [Candidatus Hypogeohydataceae bacterium YC41]